MQPVNVSASTGFREYGGPSNMRSPSVWEHGEMAPFVSLQDWEHGRYEEKKN